MNVVRHPYHFILVFLLTLFAGCGDTTESIEFSQESWQLNINHTLYEPYGTLTTEIDHEGNYLFTVPALCPGCEEEIHEKVLSSDQLSKLEGLMTDAKLFSQKDKIVNDRNCADGGASTYIVEIDGLEPHEFIRGGCPGPKDPGGALGEFLDFIRDLRPEA